MAQAPEALALAGARRAGKSATAFRTISEVASELDVPQHVLRFWETRFPQVKPLKRAGGRRYYRPEDVALLRRIRDLLYREGFTIKGAQKHLRESVGKGPAAASAAGDARDGRATPSAAAPAARAASPAAGAAPATAARPVDGKLLKAMLDELVALRELVRTKLR